MGAPKKHTLITIGYTGSKIAYLDTPLDKVIEMYQKENFVFGWEKDYQDVEVTEDMIDIIEFDDKFGTYSAWGHE